MSVSTTMQIGGDTVDLTKPAEVVAALEKIKLLVASGGKPQIVRTGSDEVTYTSANLSGLNSLIADWQAKANRQAGKGRGRARSVRWR